MCNIKYTVQKLNNMTANPIRKPLKISVALRESSREDYFCFGILSSLEWQLI